MRQNVLARMFAVEHRGDEEREDELRDRRQQEDAERVAQRRPEVGLRQDPDVLVEADERAGVADEVPFLERDHRGVDDREEPHDREQDEERRDVEVGRDLQIPAAHVAGEKESTRGLVRGWADRRMPRPATRARVGSGHGALRSVESGRGVECVRAARPARTPCSSDRVAGLEGRMTSARPRCSTTVSGSSSPSKTRVTAFCSASWYLKYSAPL